MTPSKKDFKHTEAELLQCFLYNKVHDKPLPNDVTIIEYDLYGEKNPWEIWEEFGGTHSYDGKDLYFFTILKKKSNSRYVRTIGMGSWEGEDVGKVIMANNQKLGLRKRYCFEKSHTDQDGRWIMHEYTLDSSLISNPSAINYVICRFRNNLGYKPHKKDTTNTKQEDTKVKRQKKTIVLGLAATNEFDNNDVLLGEGPSDHPDTEDNTTKVEETTTITESEYKEEDKDEDDEEDDDDDLPMSWSELFSLQLTGFEECEIQEEDIIMLPNEFSKDLLLENIDIE